MRNITLDGKIIIFKTLAVPKIVYLTLIISFSKQLIEEMQKIQKAFIWNNLTSKIEHETLFNSFMERLSQKAAILSKVAQCSWITISQVCDDNFHKRKLITHYLIKSNFGINFKCHSNLDFEDSEILAFVSFYKQLFRNLCKYFFSSINIVSSFLSQPIWYNKNIKINSKPTYAEELAKQNISYLYDLFKMLK